MQRRSERAVQGLGAIKHKKHGEERGCVVFERKLNTLVVFVHISKITMFCVNLEHSIGASKKGKEEKLVTRGAVQLETTEGLRYKSLKQYGLFHRETYAV